MGKVVAARSDPLIVGAGPVGLAAYLFLARAGVSTRIIDSAQRSEHSRALAVNPRTLELLEITGVTERMLELGAPVRGAQFWRGTRSIAELSFTGLKHKYPYMVALSQAVTERLLEETLTALGVHVQRGVALIACRPQADGVEAQLCRRSDGVREIVRSPWLLAADGARSTVRHTMNVAFEGSTFSEEWHLTDLPLRTSLPPDFAHVFFYDSSGRRSQ
jgi:2-polyprenyl-6-methoxyphenol hydroxylase-like FAD-dependent oxidoreductase